MRKALWTLMLSVWTIGGMSAENPVIINFTKTQYGAANKNWSISEGPRGTMYFGNDIGLLEFDGVEWRLNKLPNEQVVRSVYATSGHTLYTGGFEEFGRWDRQPDGKLEYTSLSAALPADTWHNDDIWRILPQGDFIYFQSFSGLFYGHTQSDEAQKFPSPKNFHFLMQVRNELWVQESEKGLYRIEGTQLIGIPGSEIFGRTEVKAVLPYQKDYLIVTSNMGLYTYDGKEFALLNTDYMLTSAGINCGIAGSNGHYYLGTILDGIYVLDGNGQVVNHINADAHLQNNTILALHENAYGHIWAALDKGITCILELPGIGCYVDPTGKMGAVYAASLYAGKLFVGTNQGLFYMDSNNLPRANRIPSGLTAMKEIKGQVWDLKVIDGKLYCGYNDGLRVIDSGLNVQAPLRNNREGVFSIQEHGDYVLMGGYASLKVLRAATGELLLDTIREPFVNVRVDHLNNIWLEHLNRGVYRCQLTPDMRGVRTAVFYGEKSGLPYKLHLFRVGGRIALLGDGTFYTYNDISGKVEAYQSLNDCLVDIPVIKNVADLDQNRFWVMGENVLYRIVNDGSQNLVEGKFDIGYNGMSLVSHFERIIALTDTTSLVCLDNGFLISNNDKQYRSLSLATPYIRSFTARRADNKSLYVAADKMPSVPFTYKVVQLSFGTRDALAHNVSFQYMLDGVEGWSKPEKINKVVYERLPKGTYTFYLRTVDNLGNQSEPITYRFEVLAPWYLTIWAYIGYALLIIGLLALARAYVLRRYRRQHLMRIRMRESKRLSQVNEELQHQIKEKNAELFSQSSFVMQRNELILRMKDEIEDFYKIHNNKALAPLYHKINMLFNSNLDTEDDWRHFLIKFEEKHGDFFKRLKTEYPQLSANDLKLCACLYLNMDSKEVAALMNVSVRAVENARYRLRKKINLTSNDNLVDFLLKH